jgi:hypothetical protein
LQYITGGNRTLIKSKSMLLHIDDTMLVSDIQEDFSDSYPFLKIEFYTEPHHYKQASSDTHRVKPDETIGAIRKIHDSGNLELLSWYTTGRVERDFKEKFGLNVQVFRKEAGTWGQSVRTDSYSLAEQIERAKQAALLAPKKKQRAVEYEYL